MIELVGCEIWEGGTPRTRVMDEGDRVISKPRVTPRSADYHYTDENINMYPTLKLDHRSQAPEDLSSP